MMIRTLLATIGLLVLTGGPVFGSAVFEIQQLEDELEVSEQGIYSMIFADKLEVELGEVCGEESLQLAREYEQIIRTNLDESYGDLSAAAVLELSFSLYERLSRYQEEVGKYDNSLFCSLKYILYKIQNYLRERHLDILEETEIVNDFGGFSDELYGYEVKIETLERMQEHNAHRKDRLGTELTFAVENPSFKSELGPQKRQLLTETEEVLKLMVYKSLARLVDEGIFTQEDVSVLADVLTIEYIASCNTYHGNYQIKETTTTAGEHVGFDTQRLLLRANLCTNYFVLKDLERTFEKIVTHEFGHHFFYYHDDHSEQFTNLCRNSSHQKNDVCDGDDFVSNYAQSQANEDYAEHFMYWVLDIVPGESFILDKKSTHFDALTR